MKIKHQNYYNFNHAEIDKRFKGQLTYVGDLLLNGESKPVAVYKAAKPNKNKGHKEYMLLQISSDGRQGIVRGMELKDIKKHSLHFGILCKECGTVLYSVEVHNFHSCNCPNDTFVDGGRDYRRCGSLKLSKTELCDVDVIGNKIKTLVNNKVKVTKIKK